MAPVAFKSTVAARSRQTRCCAVKAVPAHKAASVATVGVVAAALLAASPAFAGVSLEQPKLKNFTREAEQVLKAPVEKAEKAVKAPKGESQVPNILPSSFNTQALWPLGVVASAAFCFGAIKVDPGTKALFDNAVKDSSPKGVGIGTEDALKNKGGYSAPYYEAQTRDGKFPLGGEMGTKMLKKKAPKRKELKKKGASKKGLGGGLF